jgi:hypothetical protein
MTFSIELPLSPRCYGKLSSCLRFKIQPAMPESLPGIAPVCQPVCSNPLDPFTFGAAGAGPCAFPLLNHEV